MTTRSEELKRAIAEERRELGRHFDRLQDRLHEKTDVKGYVRRNPGPMLGVALGAGLLLGLATGGSSRPDDDEEDDTERWSFRDRRGGHGEGPAGRGAQLRSALFGMAAARLSELVLDRIADYVAARNQATHGPAHDEPDPIAAS